MLTEAELQKQWESLTFTDDFIFSRVMHDENICRQVVELILGVRIGKIVYLSAQDEHKTDPDSMRIIMDVFLRDDNRIITVEMQTGHKKELPKRSRYYQSVADVSTTPTGAKYRNLPDNILIFICPSWTCSWGSISSAKPEMMIFLSMIASPFDFRFFTKNRTAIYAIPQNVQF